MIKRKLAGEIKGKLESFPAVALLGPRQSGKTTLAKTLPGAYFDLEQEQDRLSLDLRWDELVRGKGLIILDEAQVVPEIFPRIRGAIDADRKRNRRFLLLGSVAPALMKSVSESLAGRLAICELQPLIFPELKKPQTDDPLWLRGGFPDGGILKKKNYPDWENNYLTLLAERDLPSWGLPAKPQLTKRFFKMLAVYHGQIWNASAVSSSLGLSYHTVNHYLEYLQNTYLIRLLPPFHANIRKRLVKSPKIYWRDSGLLHALMNVVDWNDLLAQPWVGASWEGWCISQILGFLTSSGKKYDAYFFRSSDGHEIDLVLKLPKGLWAFEFKLTSVPSPADMVKLNDVADLVGADRRILVTRTTRSEMGLRFVSANIRDCVTKILSKEA